MIRGLFQTEQAYGCGEPMKKIEYYAEIFKKNIRLLICPICGSDFGFSALSLTCVKGHSFDLSAKGSLNLLYPQKKSTGIYSAELWENREAVFESGFFTPLINETADIILNSGFIKPVVADLGCGEGSFLRQIHALVETGAAIGIDISKDAVKRAAAKPLSPVMWLVANTAALPLRDNSVDVAIIMLSPSNYANCLRVVKKGGLVIKILPGKDYLKEIREAIFGKEKGADYDNVKTAALFRETFSAVHERDVEYHFEVEPEMLPGFFAMTPLSEGREYSEELLKGISGVSASFKILYSVLP